MPRRRRRAPYVTDVPAALDAIVVRALDPDPARRYPNGNAMADALESFVLRPDPASPTVATDSAMLHAAADGADAAGGSIAAIAGAIAAPLHPPGAAAGPVRPAGRRASPLIAGPLAVLLVVAIVVVGALLVAALPGGDTGGLAVATTTPGPSRTPAATARPTATVRPTPRPTARPTAVPEGHATHHRPAGRRHRAICATRSSGSRAVSGRADTSRRGSPRRSGSRSATVGRPCWPNTTSSSSGGTPAC